MSARSAAMEVFPTMTDVLTRIPALAPPSPPPAAPFEGSVAADLALTVAPCAGRFQPLDLVAAERPLQAGEVVGHVIGGRGRTDEVRCPVDARVGDLLVRPGQSVTRGQGLIWLRREQGLPS